MCGPLLWGFGWIFPVIGFLMCLGFLVMAFRFASTGSGFMCMGGHRGMSNGPDAKTSAGRDETSQLNASR